MAPRSRPSRERRARHRAAAERTARRDSLLVLLSRIQRTVPVTPTEAALLRAHVEVELTDADQARAALGQQEAQHRQQLAAAHAAIREAEQDASDVREQLLAYRAVEAQRQADAATYAGRLDALRQQTGEALLAGAEEALHRATTAEAALDRVHAECARLALDSPWGRSVRSRILAAISKATPEQP